MANWKNVERSVANYLGGERVPITGRIRSKGLPDIQKSTDFVEVNDVPESLKNYIGSGSLFDTYVFEIKHRKQIPKFLKELSKTPKTDGTYKISSLEYFRNKSLDSYEFDGVECIDIAEWIVNAFEQAKAAGKNKIPVVILHEKNKKIKDSVVLWL